MNKTTPIVEVEDEELIINCGGTRKIKFDRWNFIKTLHKAMTAGNSLGLEKEHDYERLGCRQYIFDRDKCLSLGIIPVSECRRASNLDSIDDNDGWTYAAIQVDCYDKSNYIFEDTETFVFRNEKFMEIIRRGSDKFSKYDIFDGAIEYPETWATHNGCLILNEAFEINVHTIRDALERFIKNDYEDVEFEHSSGEDYCIMPLHTSDYPCDVCGLDCEKKLHIKHKIKSYNKQRLPRSTICLSCLPSFMSKYLDYDFGKVNRMIMSKTL
mgnify:CR=1 FL=1